MNNTHQQASRSERRTLAVVIAVLLAMFMVKAEAALIRGNMLPLKATVASAQP